MCCILNSNSPDGDELLIIKPNSPDGEMLFIKPNLPDGDTVYYVTVW